MKHLTFLFILFASLMTASCRVHHDSLRIGSESDLFPESMAMSEDGQTIFLSSLRRSKIVSYHIPTKTVRDLIQPEQFGYSEGTGLFVRDGLLYALTNRPGESKLLVIDPESGDLKRLVSLAGNDLYFNDLTVSRGGTVYITDSEGHAVYLVQPGGAAEKFLTGEQFMFLNGITLSEDEKYMYVYSWTNGIRIVEMDGGKVINPDDKVTASIGVDKLMYHDGNLFGIVNGLAEKSNHGLVRFNLSDNGRMLLHAQSVLVNHPDMAMPTSFDIYDGHAYVLANSYLKSTEGSNRKMEPPLILMTELREDDHVH